ncbi:MAG: pyridoxamine 5'-phosphate oxidase [Alphaproteobacteria bacterium]|nr:pyridoxamine 5'-phosphate oxidase [Alphaproteobacteria bacterium]
MSPEQRGKIIAVIDAVEDLTIATVREDGFPQATTVSYVNDGLTLYFGTNARSQKARNIARCAKVSVTINRPYKSWDEIEGLSIGGVASAVEDAGERAKVGALMFEKFPQIAQYAGDVSGQDLALIRIDPMVIAHLDYAKGFGHVDAYAL